MRNIKQRNVQLNGQTRKIETGVGTAFVTINDDEDGPFEVFVNISKAGSDIQADAEAIGRLLSFIFRMPDGLTQMERAEEVVYQLKDIGGSRPTGDVRSMPDGVAKALKMHIGVDDGTHAAV